MKSPIFAIYGVSGFGREIMPLARASPDVVDTARLVFVDDNATAPLVNGQRVVRYSEFTELEASSRAAAIAIASSTTRERLAERLARDGVRAWSLRASNVVVMDDVVLGEGSLLCAFVTLTSNIKVGRYFHANIYSYVAHDCVIGDFVTFAPGVKCNGNVHIEDHAYIGTGAVLKQGAPGKPLVIGARSVVGMGAVVTKDVPAGETVVGNPARPIARK